MDAETTRILKSCPSPSRTCSYDEQGMKRFVETKINDTQKSEFGFWLRLGFFIIPFVITFFVWISNLEKRVSKVEFSQNEITEIKNDVKTVAHELIKLTIEIEKIKTEIMRK